MRGQSSSASSGSRLTHDGFAAPALPRSDPSGEAQVVPECIVDFILVAGRAPGGVVAGRDTGYLGGPDFVPQRDVREVVLHRPAVERRLGQRLIAETVNRGEQLPPHPAIVLEQRIPILGHRYLLTCGAGSLGWRAGAWSSGDPAKSEQCQGYHLLPPLAVARRGPCARAWAEPRSADDPSAPCCRRCGGGERRDDYRGRPV
jgi:hypothetical protein